MRRSPVRSAALVFVLLATVVGGCGIFADGKENPSAQTLTRRVPIVPAVRDDGMTELIQGVLDADDVQIALEQHMARQILLGTQYLDMWSEPDWTAEFIGRTAAVFERDVDGNKFRPLGLAAELARQVSTGDYPEAPEGQPAGAPIPPTTPDSQAFLEMVGSIDGTESTSRTLEVKVISLVLLVIAEPALAAELPPGDSLVDVAIELELGNTLLADRDLNASDAVGTHSRSIVTEFGSEFRDDCDGEAICV